MIGRELPRDKLVAGVRGGVRALGEDADGFSEAILTTDRGPKRACLEVDAAVGQPCGWRPRPRARG